MSDELATLDATAQASLVRSGEASAAELVDAAIERAERLNPAVNAVIHTQYELARETAAGELPDGPFRGVPFALKDLGSGMEAGQPLHMGMRALKDAGYRAPLDSYLVERFRAAGFVTIGRTNTPELGILPTTEPKAYGPTRNPWDPGRSSGGSSGGAAAAVASGIVPVAHASDGGGSIRIPASACGLVGMKPTRARSTLGPVVGDSLSGMTVDGVVSSSVRDLAAALDAIEGAAPGDPYVAPGPERRYIEEIATAPGRLRIAVTTTALVEQHVHPQCERATHDAARLLDSLGHDVVEGSPLEAAVGGLGGGGLDVFDSFLTRWGAGQASTLDQIGRVAGRELAERDVEPLTWALAEVGRARNASRYVADVALHQRLSRALALWFEASADVLLTPTMAEPPVELGTHDDSGPDPMRAFTRGRSQGAFTAIFNITGQPAISLPLHWTEDGLPVGIQLAARFGREDVLIRVAAQLEQAKPWAERRPQVFAVPSPG